MFDIKLQLRSIVKVSCQCHVDGETLTKSQFHNSQGGLI